MNHIQLFRNASVIAALSFSMGLFAAPLNPHSVSGESAPESFESYQMRILRNQNQIQTDKILELRREIVELNQKLNELKPHLFKPGNPEDELKIAELNYKLLEKETKIDELTQSRGQLEKESIVIQKRLKELEIINDALTSMVELHRNAKEQNLAQFMKQLNDINSTAENLRTELEKKNSEQHSRNEKLQNQLSDKEHTIRRLDTLTGHLNSIISKKEHELDHLQGHLLSLYDEHLLVAEHQHNNSQEEQEKHNLALQDWQWQLDSMQGLNSLLLAEIEALESTLESEKQGYVDGLKQHHEASNQAHAVLLAHIQKLQENLNNEIESNSDGYKQSLVDDLALKEKLEQLSSLSHAIIHSAADYQLAHNESEQNDIFHLLTTLIHDLKNSLREEIALSNHFRILLEDYVNLAESLTHQKFQKQLAIIQGEHDTIKKNLKQENTWLEHELLTVYQEIDNKSKQLYDTEKELGYLLDLHETYYKIHNQAISLIEKEQEQLTHELVQKEQALSLLEGKLYTLDFHNNNLSAENEELQSHKDHLLDEIQKQEKEKSQLSATIDSLNSHIIQTEALIADLGAVDLSELYDTEMGQKAQQLEEKNLALITELEAEKTRNITLQTDLIHTRSNYVRERNNNYNLERILNDTASQLALIEEEKAQVALHSDRLLQEHVQLNDYVKYLEDGSKKSDTTDTQDLDKVLQEKHAELQDRVAELTIQLQNLSQILKEKERAQFQAEQKAASIEDRNQALTAELERLSQHLNFINR